MFVQHPMRNAFSGKFLIIAGAWLLSISNTFGQFPGGMGSGMGGGHGSGGRGHQSKQTESKPPESSHKATHVPLQIILTPHGGQYLTPEWNSYEVVFLPYQTRIYLFDKKLQPLSAYNVHVEMSLQLPSGGNTVRIPFQYVPQPAGSTEQDYVAANFNATQLSEEETPITLVFSNLPDSQHPKATFTPVVSQSKIRPYVAQVLPTPTDRAGIERQQICPVTGNALGSQGPISKVLIGDYPLYLCNDKCVAAVREAPEKYLPRLSTPQVQ
jgi:hypothetical protein